MASDRNLKPINLGPASMLRTVQLEESLMVPGGVYGNAIPGFTPQTITHYPVTTPDTGFVSLGFTNGVPVVCGGGVLPRIPSKEVGAGGNSLSSGRKVKLLCSFGGKIQPRPSDRALRYVGGQTRIIGVRRDVSFHDFIRKMADVYGEDVAIKYQLPDEELDALVSVSSPNDLENMMDEFEKLADGSAKLRVFLFSPSEVGSSGVTNVRTNSSANSEASGSQGANAIPLSSEAAVLPSRIASAPPPSAVVEPNPAVYPECGFGLPKPGISFQLHSTHAPSDMLTHPDYNPKQFTSPLWGEGGITSVGVNASANLEASSGQGVITVPLSSDTVVLPSGISSAPPPRAVLEPNPATYSESGFDLLKPGVSFPLHSTYAPSDILIRPDYYPQQLPLQFFGGVGVKSVGPNASANLGASSGQGATAIPLTGEASVPPCGIASAPPPRAVVESNPAIYSESGFDLLKAGVSFQPHSAYAPYGMLTHLDYYPQQLPSQFLGEGGVMSAGSNTSANSEASVGQGVIAIPLSGEVTVLPGGISSAPPPPRAVLEPNPAICSESSFDLLKPGVGLQLCSTYAPSDMLTCPDYYPQQFLGEGGPVFTQQPLTAGATLQQFVSSHVTANPNLNRVPNNPPQVRFEQFPSENTPATSTLAGCHQIPANKDQECDKIQSDFYQLLPGGVAGLSSGMQLQSHYSQFIPTVPLSCQVDTPENLFVPLQYHVKETINANENLKQVESRMGNLKLYDKFIEDIALENNVQQVVQGPTFVDANDTQKTEMPSTTSAQTTLLESLWPLEPCAVLPPPLDAQENSSSLFSNLDPWNIMQCDAHFPPPMPSKIRLRKETVAVKNHQSDDGEMTIDGNQGLGAKMRVYRGVSPSSAYPNKDSGSADEIIKQELQAVAEDVAASVLQSSLPSNTEHSSEVQSAGEEKHSDRNKCEKVEIELPERRDFGFALSADIGHLQIIKNNDLEEFRELGSGTFGTVFHGKWRGTDVAIKRINDRCFAGKPSEEKRMREDFWNEAINLADLHHPNVVAFYGVVLDGPNGSVATVTEYMVNGSLRNALHNHERSIDKWKRILIAMDVAFGMEYLHGKNIVHFDLKSDNLLVNLRDPHRPICKVGDLGLSKVKCQTLISGGVRGTLPWMAPELLNGNSNLVSEKVDIFSFGVVMWELLTGEEPYADLHYGAIIGGIVSNTLRPTVPESCDPDWRALMERCWSAEPSERPSFSEIANELRVIASKFRPKG
ncbi:unnamed protein product [Cuscuta europaea]|uniref:Protein kinase domain-containing protein n=1 Tax=Cuscuta europaea TaxID=41803 RepID=A0A9P0Z565_CUSEU|nr:unnamed protein product [Cuscuta europaea]